MKILKVRDDRTIICDYNIIYPDYDMYGELHGIIKCSEISCVFPRIFDGVEL